MGHQSRPLAPLHAADRSRGRNPRKLINRDG